MKLQMYIGGQWVDASDGSTRAIVNPATSEVIAQVAEGTARDAEAAI